MDGEKWEDEEHLLTAPSLCRSSAKVCLTWLQHPCLLLSFPSPLPGTTPLVFITPSSCVLLTELCPPPLSFPPLFLLLPPLPPYLLLLPLSLVCPPHRDVSEQLLLLLHQPAGGNGWKHVCVHLRVCVAEKREWSLVYSICMYCMNVHI